MNEMAEILLLKYEILLYPNAVLKESKKRE